MKKSLKQAIWLSAATTMLCVSGVFASCSTKEEATTVEVPTLTSVTYTGEKQTASVAENEAYTVSVNDGGTDVGNYDVVLTLTDTTKYKWETPDEGNAANKTLTFQIVQATNEIISLTMEGWTYGEAANTPTGEAKFGTIVYTYANSVDGTYTAEKPSEVGEYYVKASVEGTTNYTAAEKTAAFTIGKQKAEYTAPTANALTYTGAAQALVNAGTATGGTMQYKLGADGEYSETIPTATNAGEYTVYYKVVGDANHSDTEEANLSVTIAKMENAITSLTMAGWTYGEAAGTPTATATHGEATFTYATSEDGEYTATMPTDAGTYYVKATVAEADNYKGATQTATFTIAKADNVISVFTVKDTTCATAPEITLTATNGTATYTYYNAAKEEVAVSALTVGTYTVTATIAASTNYNEVSQTATFTVAHKYELTTTTNAVDSYACKCGDTYTFNKTVSTVRQDIDLSASTAQGISLAGISEYTTLKSLKYGEIDLGTTLASLTISDELKNATHGEQNLTAVVVDFHGNEHTISVPVTLITKSITTFTDLVDNVTYKSSRGTTADGEDKYQQGKYFVLANDLTTESYNVSGITWANKGRGFAGTLDGRGYAITGGNMYGGGLFGNIDGATIKNIKFKKVNSVGQNRTLLAGSIYNATIQDVEISIVDKKTTTSAGSYFGILASHVADNLTLTNLKIDATGSTLPFVIGHHSNNATASKYTCTNVQIIADVIYCFTSGTSGKLYFDQMDGVTYTFNGTETATDSIDPKKFGDDFEYSYTFAEPWTRYTKLKSVTLGGKDVTSVATLLTSTLVFDNLAGVVTEDMYNKTASFVVEFDVGEKNSVKVTLNIAVLGVIEEAALATRQDVILKDVSGDKTTFTIDLGSTYTGYTITAAEYSEKALSVADGVITVSDEMKNGTHGEQTMYVTATNGEKTYRFTTPITLVTESISTFDELVSCVTYKTGYAAEYQKGKYFVLANNISVSSYNTGSATTWGSGFAGTLDGRNYSLVGGSMYGGGLFGVLNGATIKNINFTDIQAGGQGGNRVVIAHHIKSATISNVKIYITSKTDMLNQTYPNSIIARQHVQNLTLTDVVIDATGSKLPYVLGQGSVTANIKATNVTIKADALECILKDNTGTITSLNGVTFESTATTEG